MKVNLEKTPSKLFSQRLSQIKYSQLIIDDLRKCQENDVSISKMNLKTAYLLNSYVLNLTAQWQVFIENLLRYGVNGISENQMDTHVLNILKYNLERNLKKFNTPNTQNIDEIFKAVLSIDKITDNLEVEGMSLSKVKGEINKMLKIRHTIAHKGYSKTQLSIEQNFDFMELLRINGDILEKVVIDYIYNYQ